MGQIRYEGKTRVFWATTVADISAPTVAEITAGTDLTPFMPKDGLSRSPSFQTVDLSTLSSEFDAEGQATWGVPVQLKVLRDTVSNDAYDLFATHATSGFLIVLPELGTGVVVAAVDAEVYPSQASIAIPNSTAGNERQMATVGISVTSEPNLSATVAA